MQLHVRRARIQNSSGQTLLTFDGTLMSLVDALLCKRGIALVNLAHLSDGVIDESQQALIVLFRPTQLAA